MLCTSHSSLCKTLLGLVKEKKPSCSWTRWLRYVCPGRSWVWSARMWLPVDHADPNLEPLAVHVSSHADQLGSILPDRRSSKACNLLTNAGRRRRARVVGEESLLRMRWRARGAGDGRRGSGRVGSGRVGVLAPAWTRRDATRVCSVVCKRREAERDGGGQGNRTGSTSRDDMYDTRLPVPDIDPSRPTKDFFFTEYSLLPHAIRFHRERARKIFFFL
jgi:hypothetical protein